jgi:hypothetical protein
MMKNRIGSLMAVFLLLAVAGFTDSIKVAAQHMAAETTPPPKLLYIVNEAIKPGRSGLAHQKTETAFSTAMANAKWPQHYLGMDSLSGKSHALFFVGYDSFADWQKDMDATQKNTMLTAALDRASMADGDLLTDIETSVYLYRDDLSFRSPVKLEDMRYMEISIYKVRPGHHKDWTDLVKLYEAACANIPGAHWALYEKAYGAESSTRFLVITPMKSLAEVDQEFKDNDAIESALGKEQMRKLHELEVSAVESTEAHLFAINPKLSYAPDSWGKANPKYWGKHTLKTATGN